MERKDGPSPKETANSVGYVVGFVFGMVGWVQKAAGGPGRSQIRWNDDSVWFRWSPAVPLCPTDSYIQRAHNHLTFAQPSQYETLARAELLELLSVLQTLSKGGGERKHFFDQQQSQSIDLYPLPHRTRQVCAKRHETVQYFVECCKCSQRRPKDKQTLSVSQPSVSKQCK